MLVNLLLMHIFRQLQLIINYLPTIQCLGICAVQTVGIVFQSLGFHLHHRFSVRCRPVYWIDIMLYNKAHCFALCTV